MLFLFALFTWKRSFSNEKFVHLTWRQLIRLSLFCFPAVVLNLGWKWKSIDYILKHFNTFKCRFYYYLGIARSTEKEIIAEKIVRYTQLPTRRAPPHHMGKPHEKVPETGGTGNGEICARPFIVIPVGWNEQG